MAQRSSTRLHQAPGGQSTMGSLIFGGGDNSADEDRPRGRGVRKFETPEQQQVGKQEPANQQRYGQQPQQQQQQQPTVESQNVSSNRYASGTSQNTGNVITDRSTTRIHAPPGGQSSFGTTSDQRGSSNRYSNGASQNTGNVITDRSTTRIHAPPGGASSFRLG
ncbi:hypothetical protein H257_04073 [Aphanomyces astaci]|uniref:Uncharacterized protein n=1 Tax=Aphanomyces astaci TaxID=112090 RepID=W4GUA5_APHAT|nr:hypothetical protein H257_04073 [Aphanomyces astaci]ETV83320.1 hypothetical protein H257_04073 [Aphanomyces astaci]RHX96545.1 hypothetical protein DYB25_006673 [Aphanomyces astaci]RHY07752.1 hypothetical protein DYB36_006562 [Aphanomyces astaci]RHY51414.1 hypothetical protein DYB38_003214 [Aphanomyces astaci]RHY53399.1 hypothetical protein DYB34_006291 [Aphanomyces astaci]|eukprot:XP_009826750.1 hypothetical protein H257_04073 [Aphanomyces astaci]